MKLELSEKAVEMLAHMLLEPFKLPLIQAGMTKGQGVPNVYMTTDRPKRKLMEHVQKWMRECVLKPVDPEGDPKCEKGYKAGKHSGFLKQSYCDYVLEVLKHYEPVGNLVEKVEAYQELEDAFNDRPRKFESMASMTAPDEDEEGEEKSNVSKIDEGKKKKDAKEA